MVVTWTVMVAAEVVELECNLNVELTGFAEQLNKECERETQA